MKLTVYLPEDRENSELDSAMYHEAGGNLCELQGEGQCVVDHGIYFGTADSREPKFCPAHYFQGGGYTIEAQ